MKPLTAFEGVVNQGPESALKPNVLREAVDVDLTANLKVRSRAGYSQPVISTTLGHSFFADDRLPFALFVDGDTLFAFHPDERAEALRSGLAPGMPLSYVVINDGVYWSNGAQRGFVTVELETLDWACPNPHGQPTLSPLPNGSFGPGRVQAAVTYLDARGRESGTVMAADLERAAAGGIRVSNIPVPADPAVAKVRIYLSNGNDPVLYLHATLTPGVTQYDALDPPRGRKLATQHLHPLPPGHIVRELNGRQFVAVDRRILWSPALRYGLFDPSRDWVALPKRIDLMEPVGAGTPGAGLWVASGSKTYFLGGSDPRQFAQTIKSPYGAVPGSAALTPATAWGLEFEDMVPSWLSRAGFFCIGLPGGQLKTFDKAAVNAVGERGAALFREENGERQVIVAQRGAHMPALAFRDKVVARTYHHDGSVS